MKKNRMIVTLMLVAIMLVTVAVPAMAATLDRNADLGYSFAWGDGEMCAYSSTSMIKANDSDWLVHVIDESRNSEQITYAMLWTLYSDWDWCVGSKTAKSYGDGDTVVGEYYDPAQVIGWEFWAGAILHENDVSMGVTSYGNWNTDAN